MKVLPLAFASEIATLDTIQEVETAPEDHCRQPFNF
jgi:hypothetical protein